MTSASMLATLSVFVDGWTLDAATQVADLDEDRALDVLDALAGHSLINVDANDSGPRFRMLESVRELAAERLADTFGLCGHRATACGVLWLTRGAGAVAA